LAFKTIGEIFADNEKEYRAMARGTAGIGGPAGTNPIGDRPGTTSTGTAASWLSTPSGRAMAIMAGELLLLAFLHMAAENRFGR
jgi:hypothetical protein